MLATQASLLHVASRTPNLAVAERMLEPPLPRHELPPGLRKGVEVGMEIQCPGG